MVNLGTAVFLSEVTSNQENKRGYVFKVTIFCTFFFKEVVVATCLYILSVPHCL